MTGTDIAMQEHHPVTLWTIDDPAAALEQASKVAQAAMRLINDRGLVQNFSGRPHVMVDGWLCIARLAKARTQVVSEAPLKDDHGNVIRDDQGRPHGWEAKVQVLDAAGDVVGDAVSQCARDEKTWKNRDDYALRSMAQTRATGKALRVALGFVATMAGFEATPAEEMPPGVPFVEPPQSEVDEAAWAAGSSGAGTPQPESGPVGGGSPVEAGDGAPDEIPWPDAAQPDNDELERLAGILLGHADTDEKRAQIAEAIAANRAAHADDLAAHVRWLTAQNARAELAKAGAA